MKRKRIQAKKITVQRTVKRRRRWMGDDAVPGPLMERWRARTGSGVGINQHGPRGDIQLVQGEDVLSSRRL